MIRYAVERLLQAATVVAAMSFVVYALIGLMPGDPIDLMISGDPKMTAADAARLRELHGLDRPLVSRYLAWAGSALEGDLGHSRAFSRPVLDVLGPRLANTAFLMVTALLVALAIGLPAGIYAAARPGSVADGAINLLSFLSVSVPTFWLALLLIILFAVTLGWLPASGFGTPGRADLADKLRHLVLPVATLAFVEAGAYARFMRAAMREALQQDYVRTARAKGASERRVVLSHALRNAMIPVTTVAALSFGTLFSGAVVTETMFAYPGMGKLIFDSIMSNDYNLALVGLLFATFVTLVGNFAADTIYAALDPRISFAGGGPERGRAA